MSARCDLLRLALSVRHLTKRRELKRHNCEISSTMPAVVRDDDRSCVCTAMDTRFDYGNKKKRIEGLKLNASELVHHLICVHTVI